MLFQLFLYSKNICGGIKQLSVPCYFLGVHASFWSAAGPSPAWVSLIMSMHNRDAEPYWTPLALLPPALTTTNKQPAQHQFPSPFVGRSGRVLQTMWASCQPGRPLTWLTAFVFGIKYEADKCVCRANYDVALHCQNISKTKFLHIGPQG